MIGVQTRVKTNKDAATAVSDGVEQALVDAMDAGFRASQETIAQEATDRGTLLQSGVPPAVQSDGSVVGGYGADYARWVNDGTAPHWAPIEPLLGWARRVLGDESAAYAVQRKIAEEGTEAVEFIQRWKAATKAHLRTRGLSAYVEDNLG